MFGYSGAEPSGLEVTPVEAPAAEPPAGTPGALDLMRELQAADGDPDALVARLQALFPGAQIDMSSDQQAAQFFGAGQPPDPIAQLERLAALKQSGALTEAEFAAAKAKLLGS